MSDDGEMDTLDLSEWNTDQIDHFEQVILALKEMNGDKPFALRPEQRAIAVRLGILEPLSVKVEVMLEGKPYTGTLHQDGDVYRGEVCLAEGESV